MEYVKTLFGSQANANQPTGAETVERLVERVQTSVLLEDRRDACRALKALSKKFRLEVGAQGMDALIKILETDRSDAEIVGYALDAISNVISGAQEEDIIPEKSDEDLGIQFTEIYIKKTENVTLLLELLDEFDFKVRWPAVKLLTGLLIHKARELQEIILVSPMGVSRLMDLLSDTREVIRNDALLLLAHLTKSNANIQKIVAFENAFDRLLDTIAEEGNSDGGVVVEDCILVMLNLLKNNTSNQNFFKEGSYIQRLTSFFDLHTETTEEDKGWTSQKVTNIHLMLQIVRTLVSPNNPVQQLLSCQKTMNQCGLLQQLCNILMASGVSADILTENINSVAEVIRGNHNNQEYFASVTAPTNPPRPAIVVLLMSMVNEKQPFGLRCAVLYCFQCFLFKNELGQAQIIQTLLPTTADMTTITAGQLLCGGLFSIDSLSNWFASVALSHALVDNPTQKEQLLRVQLATSVGNPPVSLMKQCATILQQGGKVQTRIGLLMLTSTWLAHSTLSVTHFLSMPTNIPFLTSQVALAEGDELELLVQGICAFVLGICIEYNDDSQPSFTRDDLCQLIVKRVGLDTFLDKLSIVSKHESYSRAAQNPYLKYKAPNDVLFDYEFCRLFKSLEGLIIKAVQPKPKDLTNGPESTMTPEQQKLLQQYKDVIRDQDQKLHDTKQQLEEIMTEHKMCTAQLQEMSSSIQQLRDQNALLKAQRTAANNSGERANSPNLELNQVKQELEELRQKYEKIQEELKEKNEVICRMNESKDIENTSEAQQNENSESQKMIEQLNKEIESLKQNVDHLEKELKEAQSKNSEIEKELKDVQTEKSKLTSEQEDLLVLLTEQDTKISNYQQRLKALGQEIEDDDVLHSDEDCGGENF
ncbi:general vesicular transport factor p115-like isoform X2 [Centruroides sculpturatus]|uniref:general vesicular transport factor p115-like isoform X2 n=1 Tax=Centruroides sculpturatus TaxID=218467 RepID=UPI000C6C9DDC|nr:general vesicular transport factor p115-like isoform X2 [Centruroides sculpturatus]